MAQEEWEDGAYRKVARRRRKTKPKNKHTNKNFRDAHDWVGVEEDVSLGKNKVPAGGVEVKEKRKKRNGTGSILFGCTRSLRLLKSGSSLPHAGSFLVTCELLVAMCGT